MGGIEDVLGKGMIKVGEGSRVGVIYWLYMGSWCCFLGAG
jgi:hypothetical protein